MKLKESVLRFYLKRIYKVSPPENIRSILILSNTAIGDTLFSTPLFRECKKAFPEAKISALLNPSNFKLFETNPHIDEIVLYDGKWKGFFSILKKLKKREFDVAIISHSNEPQASPLCALAGIKTIIKVPNAKNSWNFLHYNPPTPMMEDNYTVLNRLKTLEFLGAKSSDTKLELFIKEEWRESVKEFLGEHLSSRKIGFQVGASTISRQWFSERWIELGQKILEEERDAAIVFTGAPNERCMIEKIVSKLPKDRVLISAGSLSLEEGAALIGELDLLISPDTGPLHIAVALKTPSISLFAVANPECSLPEYDRELHGYIKVPKTCDPCIAKRCRYAECMEQIGVDDIMQKIRDM